MLVLNCRRQGRAQACQRAFQMQSMSPAQLQAFLTGIAPSYTQHTWIWTLQQTPVLPCLWTWSPPWIQAMHLRVLSMLIQQLSLLLCKSSQAEMQAQLQVQLLAPNNTLQHQCYLMCCNMMCSAIAIAVMPCVELNCGHCWYLQP